MRARNLQEIFFNVYKLFIKNVYKEFRFDLNVEILKLLYKMLICEYLVLLGLKYFFRRISKCIKESRIITTHCIDSAVQ